MAVGKLLTATPDKLGWSMSSIGVVITPKSFSAQKDSFLPCAQTTISDVRKKRILSGGLAKIDLFNSDPPPYK